MADGDPRRRLKPRTVCPRCDGYQDRRMAIQEKPLRRHWGDKEPLLELGEVRILQYTCIVCGNVGAYQLRAGEKP